MKITGILTLYKHCNKSAIGIVKVKNPKHEKHAKQRQKVDIAKSREDCVIPMPHNPVSNINSPFPKKNNKNTHVIIANAIGIVRNLIYDFKDILATPTTKTDINKKTKLSNIKLSNTNVTIIKIRETITLRYALVSASLLL
jgi:hypothetical protein